MPRSADHEEQASAANERLVAYIDLHHLNLLRANVKRLIRRAADEADAEGLEVLDIAPQDHAGARAQFRRSRVRTLDIDPSSGADIVADLCRDNRDNVPDNSFDMVICTEVLEHVLNPFDAVTEINRLLKPGGRVYVSTPFNFRIHGPLPDCWRFTEHGLRALFSDFIDVEIDQLEDPERFLMPIHYTLRGTKPMP